ncbi:sodium channel modifier 1 isoform X2 [Colius striatus]|uniref:sodium channel modifier 1 isoform X2 n=1 Tax=Colius striatus TaxID=57412 RepID=UPI002B1DC2E4|nr:sodium channel modifier 1 isoform X2 [Colius striatus]
MSFKRDGDDPAQLGVLQKRRVADLLANYIPEDEALLLRSGRYACTVCAHRPVFDTLDMLTVHRAGRRHTGALQRWFGRRRSLRDAAPRQQEAAPGAAAAQGSPAPLLARTRRIARSALLKEAPYSSCCRRTGAEGSGSRADGSPCGAGAAPESSPAAELPGHRGTTPDPPQAAAARTQPSSEGKGWSSAPGQPQGLSPERRRVLQRYLQLRSAGWIQDPSGKWVKDENVEFDSDEEEPPALLPA